MLPHIVVIIQIFYDMKMEFNIYIQDHEEP